MPRARNDERREYIKKRVAELLPELYTMTLVVDTIAKELDMTPAGVRYYTADPKNSRKFYSEFIRNKVSLMDIPEIKEYAKRLGRPWRRLYEISLEERKGTRPSLRADKAADTRQHITDCRKFMTFGSAAELKCFDLTVNQVRAANKVLRLKYGLCLITPNYLVHRKSQRRFFLNYQDQVYIVRRPEEFIIRNAKRIAEGWERLHDDAADLLGLGL